MSKIGKKIVLSYLIIVLFTVGISMGITKMNFSNNLNAKIVSDLNIAADHILSQIQDSLSLYREQHGKMANLTDIFPDKVFYSHQYPNANFIVQNKQKDVVFESWNLEEGEAFFNSNDPKKKYFVLERTILAEDDKSVIGYLLVIGEKEELGIINSLINRALMAGLAISLFSAILLAFFFERTFIRPINLLKKNIQSFSIDGENEWEEINTKDEISDLNISFQKMGNRMVKYDKKQKEFFQNTSHELKTPLMSIQGYAEAIRDHVISEEDVDDSLNIIIDETNKLTNTVNSIVYMTKLDNPGEDIDKNRVQNIEVHDFVNEVLYKFKFVAEEKHIELLNSVEEHLIHRLDEEYMFRIINNLVSNALRYAKSKVEVQGQQEGDFMRIKVIDDGQGFDTKEMDLIFDRFYKGEKGNTGLGLAIVKSTVKQLKGTVSGYNISPHGACVDILIPTSKTGQEKTQKSGNKKLFHLQRGGVNLRDKIRKF